MRAPAWCDGKNEKSDERSVDIHAVIAMVTLS